MPRKSSNWEEIDGVEEYSRKSEAEYEERRDAQMRELEKIDALKAGEYHTITTRFRDRYNEPLQLYARKRSDGSIMLSDDGDTLSGFDLDSFIAEMPEAYERLKSVLLECEVQLEIRSLTVTTNRKDYFDKKHNLLRVMLSINLDESITN